MTAAYLPLRTLLLSVSGWGSPDPYGGPPGRKMTDAAVKRLVPDLAERADAPPEDDR